MCIYFCSVKKVNLLFNSVLVKEDNTCQIYRLIKSYLNTVQRSLTFSDMLSKRSLDGFLLIHRDDDDGNVTDCLKTYGFDLYQQQKLFESKFYC